MYDAFRHFFFENSRVNDKLVFFNFLGFWGLGIRETCSFWWWLIRTGSYATKTNKIHKISPKIDPETLNQGWAGKNIFEFPFPVFAFAGNTCCFLLPTRQHILLPATKNVAGKSEIVLPEISGNLLFVAGKHIAGNQSVFSGNFSRLLPVNFFMENMKRALKLITESEPTFIQSSLMPAFITQSKSPFQLIIV